VSRYQTDLRKGHIKGSRINIWKQDPTVKELGVRTTFIHNKVDPGPSDPQIVIKGVPIVYPDSNGDFLFPTPVQYVVEDIYNPPKVTFEEKNFDAAHTYAVVRKVLIMFERVLGKKIKWAWNSKTNDDPLQVYPHANLGRSAFYERDLKSIRFQYYYIPEHIPIFTCRSLDVVSHETGHAIFDALKPGWSFSEPRRGVSLEIGAIQESLADLSSIFLILSQLDLVEYIITETKADLKFEKNILAVWWEQLEEIGFMGPRSAINDLKLSEAGTQVHRISEVFTAAVYDILADIFYSSKEPDFRSDGETLYLIGQYMLSLIVKAVLRSPDTKVAFADIVNEMIKITKETSRFDHAEIIRKNFITREILLDNGQIKSKVDLSTLIPDYKGCCGTLSGHSHPK
jgi:hypothetical protein